MPSATSKGWPYVGPTDVVADYPVTSQALADKADAAVPYAIAQGVVTISWAATTQSAVTTVTLPVGRFSQPPLVQLTNASAPQQQMYAPRVSGTPTASSFQCVQSVDGSAITASANLNWLAMQMLPGASPG